MIKQRVFSTPTKFEEPHLAAANKRQDELNLLWMYG